MTIRIAGGQGFYGDARGPVADLVEDGVDFLVLEALAELTMAILQKDRQKDPGLGYTRDFPLYAQLALPAIAEGRTRLITNSGGINPDGAREMLSKVTAMTGHQGIKVAVVTGDDVLDSLDDFHAAGAALAHLDTGVPYGDVAGRLRFACAYLGARPIVEALDAGAQIVITGRVADAALFLAPMIHAHGWSWDDWDRLAAGVVVGHLCECSGQVSGGNFSGPWWDVPVEQAARFAFPIAEVDEDGTAVITKAKSAGGLVSVDTVKEQLLYEVGDPTAYLTPDVVANFTAVHLEDAGPDRVRVSGATGRPATDTYKVVGAFPGGYTGEISIGFPWPNAEAKARRAAALIRERLRIAGLEPLETVEEYFGLGVYLGGSAGAPDLLPEGFDPPEVILRFAARFEDRDSAGRLAREAIPLGLSGPPAMGGLGRGGGGRPSELLEIWPALVPKDLVDGRVSVDVGEV